MTRHHFHYPAARRPATRLNGFRFARLLLLLAILLVPAVAQAGPAAQTTGQTMDRFLAFLANPNVAYLLLVLGLLGIIAEVATAGAVFPGVFGVICLLLSFYTLLRLPTNWIGFALILAGIAMFLLDIKVTGIALSIGGAIAFTLGSLLLFTPFWVEAPELATPVPRLNPWVIVATTAGVTAFFAFGLAAGIRAQRRPLAMGTETLLGRTGVVRRPLDPEGIVHIEGEEWTASSANGAPVAAGVHVRVTGLNGLTLRVEPIDEAVS